MDDQRAKTEPAAELRQLARILWENYVALTDEGFSEDQALKIIAAILASATQS